MKFKFFQIEVTRKCNLSCIHCPSPLFSKKDHMDFNTFLKISEYFDSTDLIHLQGWGEPFLHPQILEMIKIAKEHAKTGLTTNGTMLKKFAKDLVTLQLDYIAVSISGPNTHARIRKGSTFDQIIRGIDSLNDAKRENKSSLPMINLTYLITKTNFGEVPLALKLAEKLKAGLILTNLDYVFSKETYELKAFDSKVSKEVEKIVSKVENEAKAKNIPFKRPLFQSEEMLVCDAFPLSALVFSTEGDVFPCVYLNLPFSEVQRYFKGERVVVKKPNFGNILENDLDEIWNSQHYSIFREKFRERMDTTKSLKYIFFGFSRISKLPIPECCKGCYKLFGI